MERQRENSGARPRQGITYAGRGNLESAARAIETASRRAWMRCESPPPGDGIQRVVALQESPWYKTIAMALPQRVVWEVRQDGDRLSIYAEFRAFGWYLALLLTLFLYVLLCILSAFLATGQGSPFAWDWSRLVVAGFLLPALVLAFVIVRLLGALGGGRQAEALWPAVVTGVEQEGGFLEPVGRTVSLPYAASILAYAGVFLGFGIWLVWSNSGQSSEAEGLTFLLTVLLAAAFVLIVGAMLMVIRRGFIIRTIPLLAGLSTATSGLIFLALQLPWWLVSQMEAPPFLPFLDTGKEVVVALEGPSPEQMNSPLAARFLSFQTACRLGIGITPFLLFLASSFGLYGIYLSIFSWPQLLRIHRHRDKGIYRQAVSGGALLRLFRGIFVTSWMFFSGLILTALGLAVLNAFQSLAPVLSHPQFRLAELSAGMSAVALGLSVDNPWLEAVVRVGWIAFGLAASVPLMVSIGQLFFAQRAGRRALRAAAGSPTHPKQHEIEEMLAACCREVRIGRVRVVVTTGTSLAPSAAVFGLWTAERFIEISSDCFDVLDNEDLEAIIAHELAHHLEGHCRRDQLLRWLGRVTLVGDGFVLALQDSWGYERGADRVAVEKIGISKKILGRSLLKLRHARAMAHLAGKDRCGVVHPMGLPASPELHLDRERQNEPDDLARLLNGGPAALELKERWRLAWKLFRRQYFSAMDVHYWHPGESDRTQALTSVAGGPPSLGSRPMK